MVNITKVKIENFQSHKDTTLEFVKGLNVITGPSDQGKSAIIRAIKWALYNEPRGTDFIRYGAEYAKVTVGLSNGFKIIRERSQSRNRYTVINPEKKSIVLEGFGNDVPEEVVKAHGIPKIVIDSDISSSLNIADQLEGPFLLSETGALRAKAIGRLTGLHVIDRAIRECMADLRRENQELARIQNDLDNVCKKLEKYDKLYIVEEKLDKYAAAVRECEMYVARLKTVSRLKEDLLKTEREIGRNIDILNDNKEKTGILIDEYVRLLKDWGTCPTCGSEICEERLENIIGKYREFN